MPVLANSFAWFVTICILQKLTVATTAKDSSDGDDRAPIEIEIGQHFAYRNRAIGGKQRGLGPDHDRDHGKTAKTE
jgi:hypothetical protein